MLDVHSIKDMTEEEYLEYTVKVFQPKSARPLTLEDARALKDTAVRFIGALGELHKAVTEHDSVDKPNNSESDKPTP